ncbi:CHAD domain-containing protein [Glycomyces buryatensis]|nr:CHAD domain-containing protein [Glycomyces buryatensis]
MAATMSAGAAVHEYFAGQVKAMRKFRKPALRADEDAVHRMRVATRRLRSLLLSYGDLYAEMPLRRKRLRWLAGVLGEIRDLEVLRMRFAEELGDDRPLWFRELAEAERRAYGRLDAAFARKRFRRLIRAAERMAKHPHFTLAAVGDSEEVLAPVVASAERDLEAAFAAIADASDPDAARHVARKVAKRTRYTAEAAAAALGEEAEAVAARAKRLQTVCGHYQDCVVAIAYVEAHADPADPTRDQVLAAEHRRRAEDLEAVETARAELAAA